MGIKFTWKIFELVENGSFSQYYEDHYKRVSLIECIHQIPDATSDIHPQTDFINKFDEYTDGVDIALVIAL